MPSYGFTIRIADNAEYAPPLLPAVGRVAQFAGLIGTAALGATAVGYAKFTSPTSLAATQMAKITR